MRRFIVLFQKEFLLIRRNSFLPKMIIGFPIIIMLIMPLVMTMDVRNVNIAVVDLDHSTTSNRIISHIEASEYLSLVGTTEQYIVAMDALENGTVDIIVQIPNNFERDMIVSTPEKINITANAVNATKGSLGSQYLVQTIARALQELKNEKSPTQLSELVTVQNRFNPTLNYRHYMIPALMIILFILICGFLPALSIVGEKESGTIEQINVTPVSRMTFILSKLIPYWLIGLFVLTIAMIVARVVYGLYPVGSIGLIYFGAACFILTISGFSLTIANFSETMQQTMFVMFFFVMIFMLMSGLLTPIDSMPNWAQKFTGILPPRYFVEILRSVYLKGSTFMDLWHNYLALGIFATIFNILAALTYKKQA
ncbi:MAG: ABC transporter permease [Muribaculaceae bacterium]|nr:ABC transporter permease [Muribaculaceae bacterium]MBR5332044.1 ABC transporter permease [Muribaculaceae bacterium]